MEMIRQSAGPFNCDSSWHRGCLPNPNPRSGRPRPVDADFPPDTVTCLCPACKKHPPRCGICSEAGDDPVLGARDEGVERAGMFFRCVRCNFEVSWTQCEKWECSGRTPGLISDF